jgi:hypothetical protein
MISGEINVWTASTDNADVYKHPLAALVTLSKDDKKEDEEGVKDGVTDKDGLADGVDETVHV